MIFHTIPENIGIYFSNSELLVIDKHTILVYYFMDTLEDTMYGYAPFGGSPLMSFLPLITIVIIATFFGIRRSGSNLVLKEFRLNENEEEYFKISGRAAGLFNWILANMGINPLISLSCNKQTVIFESTAVRYGKTKLTIPLVGITGVTTGVYKPFSYLIFGVVSFILGIIIAFFPYVPSFPVFILGLLVGIIFVVLYFLRKLMLFSIYASGDRPVATIYMKKSIIEGQNIDEQKCEQAAALLNNAVLNIHVTLAKM